MKFPTLRGRGLRPSTLLARTGWRSRPQLISRSRLTRFIEETGRLPAPGLPAKAPRSIALVVPCYAHAAYVPRMLESIAAQTRRPDEVILIDDCSPDNSGDLLQSFIATSERQAGRRFTLLVNDRNLGQAASLNRGISIASSDLIMILNDDDYLMHDAIESMLALFAQHRDVALIGATCVVFSGDDALSTAAKISTAHAIPGLPLRFYRPEDVPAYRHPNDLNMTHSSSCFYKVAWSAVGGYRTDKKKRVVPFSDRDFQIRVNALWSVAVAVQTPYAFWRSDSSVDNGLDS